MVLAMAWQIPISFFGIGVLHGLAPILASESFPTKFRYSGTGISYNISAYPRFWWNDRAFPVGGLIGQDVFQRWYFVPLLYAFYCVVAMLALLFIPETRDVNHKDLDQMEAGHPITLGLRKALPDQFGGGYRGPNT
jgi:MHS family shikimate/dehydroshikimate transporter-like MFS transporter